VAHPTKILGGPWPTRPTLQRPPCPKLIIRLFFFKAKAKADFFVQGQVQGEIFPKPATIDWIRLTFILILMYFYYENSCFKN